MYKTTVETRLRVGSIIKINESIEYTDPGKYAVHEVVVGFDRLNMKVKSKNVTYFLENLANSNRDDCLYESDLNDAVAAGSIELVDEDAKLYKVDYTDLTDNQEKTDYVYVEPGFEGISNEYFETRVERDITASNFDPIELVKHEIKVHDYSLCE